MASTSSPVVNIPTNGEKAIEQVAQRYGLKWMVIVDGCFADSKDVCDQIVKGKKKTLGAYSLVRELTFNRATLFRLVRK